MRDKYKFVFGKPHQFSLGLGIAIAILPRLPRQRLELLLCARWRKLTVKDTHPAPLNATSRFNLHRQLVTDVSVPFDVAEGDGSDADMRFERTLGGLLGSPLTENHTNMCFVSAANSFAPQGFS